MRVFVVHNAQGRIRSFAIPAVGARGQVTLEAPRGWAVSEVDVPGIDDAPGHDLREQVRHVQEALKHARVKRTRGEAALVSGRARGAR